MNTLYVIFIVITVSVFFLGCIYRLKKSKDSAIEKLQQELQDTNKQLNNNNNQIKLHKQQANTAKTRYLSGVSHELRTPLNVIMGYAQILEKQAKDNDPNKDKFTLIRHNCEHLNHLIEGILEFSAIEAGKLKVQFEVIDLHDLVNRVIAMYLHQAELKGLKFISHIDKNLPLTVKTDQKRLQQILLNLLNNAIKFTDSGDINFTITYKNQVATFSIKDSGRGIKNEDLERIFEPFERIEHANKPIKGTGLGLPITRLLVELMGGELSVNSQVEKGSEFKVKMMLAPQGVSNNSHNSQLNDFKVLNQTLSKEKHILVVDDEQSHRQLIADILQQHEFQITTVADASTAKIAMRQKPVSLAVIDVAMPIINGWELAQWSKTNSPNTKVLMLSANPRDVQSSSEQAHDAYLTKPVKINQLLNEINRLLELGWETSPTTEMTNEPYSKIVLAEAHLDALSNMLEIGHIKGIETYLNKLLTEGFLTKQQYSQMMKPLNDMNLGALKLMIDHE